jgi:hypothetical protein
VASFSSTSFDTAAFSSLAFFFDGESPPTTTVTPTGGYVFLGFDHAQAKRDRKKRELEEMEREQETIADTQSREIANLLREQEAKDADRADLERIQALADQYVRSPEPVPVNVRAALYNAHEQRTRNSLEQMRREIETMYEQEEQALIAALLMDD